MPIQLRHALDRCVKDSPIMGRVLDLGCGAGLCGIAFNDLARELVGVDVSTKMLEEARRLNFYHTLVHTDIISYLRTTLRPFDIIVAADVLIYLGDSQLLFEKLQQILVPGGVFCVSIETHSQSANYFLNPTGRFSHSSVYIESLATHNGLSLLYKEEITLRSQGENPVAGVIYIFKRPLCLCFLASHHFLKAVDTEPVY